MANNVLAVDYGSVRVGLAISEGGQPPKRYKTITGGDVVETVAAIVREQDVKAVVVGLPRNLDGEDTAQTGKARQFAAALRERAGVDIVLQDEAGTSGLARERLKSQSLTDRDLVDAEAAVIILEDYLREK